MQNSPRKTFFKIVIFLFSRKKEICRDTKQFSDVSRTHLQVQQSHDRKQFIHLSTKMTDFRRDYLAITKLIPGMAGYAVFASGDF